MKAMQKTTKALFALTFSVMLLAGGFTTVWAQQAEHEAAAEGMAATLTADSVQVVHITIGPEGFEPATLTLEADVPARLVFTRTTDGTCATQVQIPAFDIQKTDLPLKEPVSIEFTPTEAGTFTFACGMDMLKGAIIVKS